MINLYFKIAPDTLALIRKGFTMAQNIPLVILYLSAFENFKISKVQLLSVGKISRYNRSINGIVSLMIAGLVPRRI